MLGGGAPEDVREAQATASFAYKARAGEGGCLHPPVRLSRCVSSPVVVAAAAATPNPARGTTHPPHQCEKGTRKSLFPYTFSWPSTKIKDYHNCKKDPSPFGIFHERLIHWHRGVRKEGGGGALFSYPFLGQV